MKNTYHHGDLRWSAINKAIELIEERREVNFTLREISTLLEVSHSAIYRHFPSKKFLLIAIAEEGFRELNKIFLNRKSSLKLICTDYIIFASEKQGHFRSMFHQDLRCGDTSLPESFIIESEKCYNFLREAVQNSPSEHSLKVDLELITRTIWSSIHGFAQLLIDGQFSDIRDMPEIKKAIKVHLKLIGIKG